MLWLCFGPLWVPGDVKSLPAGATFGVRGRFAPCGCPLAHFGSLEMSSRAGKPVYGGGPALLHYPVPDQAPGPGGQGAKNEGFECLKFIKIVCFPT